MEQVSYLKLSQKISHELHQSSPNNDKNSIVNSHCKRDHLSPSPFDQRKNISSYVSHHTTNKKMTNYNTPEVEKELKRFRKYENSTSALPNLPAITESSQYGTTFYGPSQDKLAKGKQQESWFLKMNWALDPKSSYQKNYCPKDGTAFNKENRQRPNHSHLTVFELHEAHKKNSSYKTQFQAYSIKKQAEIVIGNKDHLHHKDSFENDTAITEYQRRYDSLMEVAKPKESLFSIYRKQTIARQSRLKL